MSELPELPYMEDSDPLPAQPSWDLPPQDQQEQPQIKIEPGSPVDSDALADDLACNSDQDDAGSNIWDFTDEEFNDEVDSQDESLSSDQDKPKRRDIPSVSWLSQDRTTARDDTTSTGVRRKAEQSSVKDPFDDLERMHSDFNDRFGKPYNEKAQQQQEDEKILNTLFYQSLDWRKINNDFPYAIPGVKDFDVQDGVQVPELLEETDPYRFFTEFLHDSFLEEVARLTNKNFEIDPRTKVRNLKKRPWKPVDKEDIRTFFGLLFLFGLMKKPSIPSYWSQDPLISTECMNRIMSHRRFTDIKRYICFYDKSLPKPANDAFYKIRMFQDHVINNSKRIYIPERDLSVDESIILYTGLHRLKVYMPQKPNRYGFKAFVLSEASTGYMCNLIMNEGRLKGNSEESFTKRIVLDILHDYQDKGYRVYMDRYYTSADLFMDMKRKGIGACGTTLLNRLKLEKRTLSDILAFKEDNSSIFYTNDSLMFTIFYHYKRQVHMISNFHDNSLTKVEKIKKTRGKDKKELQVLSVDTPTMIREYQFKMKGVDLFNQRMSYYSTNFRSLRWYFRIIYFYMEIAMINSYLVYCKVQNKLDLRARSHADYRAYVIKKMVNWQGPERIETKNSGFIRAQYHMNPQDGAKSYAPSIYDSKRLSFNSASVDLPCEIDKARLGQKCNYCDSGKKEGRIRKTLWICKVCKKYCCKGACFLKHKVQLFLKGVLNAGKGTEFINMLLASKKLKIIENDKELGKLESIDVEEYKKKKNAILQYKRSSFIGNSEFIEEKSEKSLTITNIEEIRNDDLFSDRLSEKSIESKGKKTSRERKVLEFQEEIKEIDQIFPVKKRKGRPKGVKLNIPRKKDDDDDEDYEFDKELKLSIKRRVGDERVTRRGLSQGDQIEGLNRLNQDVPGELTNINEKPSLINVRKLYRYDSSKNALKVYKSKLQEKNQQAALTNEKGDSLEAREPKKRGRKSRIERNLNFLIMDMYKTNDVRAAIKVSENKEFDYSKMFDDFEENNDWERFRLVKPAEEEIKERESSEEPQPFKRKRGRPRSLQRIDGKLRKKLVVNTRESRDVSQASDSSEEESKKSSNSEDEWKESREKKKPKKADSAFSEENEDDTPKKRRGRNPRKLIKNSEREDFDDLRTRRERLLEKRRKEESEESHKRRRERRAKESEEFDEWDKVDSDKKKRQSEEDLKRKEAERRRKQEYDMMFDEDYVDELTTRNKEHNERKKKHESRREEDEESERREVPRMEEESQHDEFVIELEITEEEKSLEENTNNNNNNKKGENCNTPITKNNRKNEKEKVGEKEKPKKMPDIVEIDDDDEVQILNPKIEKNVWVNTENDGNKISFDFDHELEDSLE